MIQAATLTVGTDRYDLPVLVGSEGEMAVDMMLFDVGIGADGSVNEDGELYVEFSDDVYGYAQIAGYVDANRISRDTELSD